jgi:hypothetical protein
LSKQISAILRNEKNEFLYRLESDELADMIWRAEQGEVEQLKVMHKGRMRLIFRQKSKPAKPSKSKNSECALNEDDARGFVGELGPIDQYQRERWAGHGLIPRLV